MSKTPPPIVNDSENKEADINNALNNINAALVLLSENIVSFEAAAKVFGVSRQTLNNWLGTHGTSNRQSPMPDDLRQRLANCRIASDTPGNKLFGGTVFIVPMLEAIKADIEAWQKQGMRINRTHSVSVSELRAFVVNTRLFVHLPATWRKLKFDALVEAICKVDSDYSPDTIASAVRRVQDVMAAQATEFAKAAKVAAKADSKQQQPA